MAGWMTENIFLKNFFLLKYTEYQYSDFQIFILT